MSKILKLVPTDFECSIEECPPGFFLYINKEVGFKSEYTADGGKPEAFCSSGEYYHGTQSVIPLTEVWEES